MQVQTGIAKGKRLKIPKSSVVRPTTGRVKKSIFDTLGNIDGATVLDLFAGSGSLGIEALSKNASHVTFIEKDGSVFKTLSENIASCGFTESSIILNQDFNKALKQLQKNHTHFDLIFIDPPYVMYEKINFIEIVDDSLKMLNTNGLVIIEHDKNFLKRLSNFELNTKSYGTTYVSFIWSKKQ